MNRKYKNLLLLGTVVFGLAGCGGRPAQKQPQELEPSAGKENKISEKSSVEVEEEKEEINAEPVHDWQVITNENGMDCFDVTLDEFYATVKSVFGDEMIYSSYIADAMIPKQEGIALMKVDMSRIPHVTLDDEVTIYAFKDSNDKVANVQVRGTADKKDQIIEDFKRICQEIDPELADPVSSLEQSTNGCCGEVNVLLQERSLTLFTSEEEMSISIRPFTGSVESWQRDIDEYCTVCSPTV